MSDFGNKPGQLTTPRTLATIAAEIRSTWPKVNYGAEPYLAAMETLGGPGDFYYQDAGKSIVLYFLYNANSYRGEAAKRIKAELKGMI